MGKMLILTIVLAAMVLLAADVNGCKSPGTYCDGMLISCCHGSCGSHKTATCPTEAQVLADAGYAKR